jgi:exopolysaccharide biosynthesis polyprenyl glycosylphosphotransferase
MNDSHDSEDPQDQALDRRPGRNRIILVGARRDARRLLQHVQTSGERRMKIIGFVDARHEQTSTPRVRGRHLAVHPRTAPIPVLGGLDRLHEVVDRTQATDLVVALRSKPGPRLLPHLAKFTNSRVTVHWVPVESSGAVEIEPAASNNPPTDLASTAEIPHEADLGPWHVHAGDLARTAKRLVDILGATCGLAVLAPLFAVVALAILVTTGRPIFYTQERVGQGGRRFRIIKFRSMRTDAERETGPIWASADDTRCTRIGDFLRHTNIDELPQLFNVLKGEMSLVGPRPERPIFVEKFQDEIPEYDLRHAVPCGMTGWAQVHGWRGPTSLRKRIQYDLDYIQRWSVSLDFIILFMTIQHILWGKTSWKLSAAQRKTGT